MITIALLCLLLGGLAVGTAPATFAQPLPPQLPVPSQLLPADQALDKVCTTLKEQQAFSVEVDTVYDNVLADEQKIQYSAYQMLSVQKPDRVRSDYVGDERVSRFYYNGKSFALLSPLQNLYVSREAPATIDAAVDAIAEKYDVTIPLSNLIVSDPCTKLKLDTLEATYIGTDMVNRVPGYHYLFTGKTRDWQLWVSEGEKPLPLKMVITYRDLPQSPQYTAVFSRWDLSPQFGEQTFAFVPPEGARAIGFLSSEPTQKPDQKPGGKK
ncbi:MAG: DUF2092 domain-containing protein [Aphanocapsa lilacina HA4352-LM1]|jgi:hypothetical protein|nr:DUF2092 domain-containing protein [Aphanocapsa lilacina HA4352-LM1]